MKLMLLVLTVALQMLTAESEASSGGLVEHDDLRRVSPKLQLPLVRRKRKRNDVTKREIENNESRQNTLPFNFPEMPVLRPVVLINPNETETERAERIHRAFEKLMTFVDIMGQVDNYFSSKVKSFVKSVSHFYEGGEEEEAAEGLVGDAKSDNCLRCASCSRG